MEARQTALEDATELARREGTFRGRDSMREYLAERGYPDQVIEEALRVAAEERREAALEHERRRNAMAERSSRVRVVVAPAVAMVLGYVLMMLAASSFGYMFVAFAVLLAPIAVFVLPAITGALT